MQSIIHPLMNLLLLCLNSLILLCTGPQKCDRSVLLPIKFARRYGGTFKIHYMSQDVSFQKGTKVWFSMTTGILKSLNPRNRNSISVISTKFLFVSSMNTLLATLKVTDARRNVILTGGLNHRFPWRPSPTPGSSITWYNAKLEIKYPSYSPSVNLNIGQVLGHIYEHV